MPYFDKPVPDILCDICQTHKATRWFGSTSAVACDNPECMTTHSHRFEEGLRQMEAMREFE